MNNEVQHLDFSLTRHLPTEAAIGPDGEILKTSVCDEIEESVKKAAQIEQELANTKVICFLPYRLFNSFRA